MSKTYIIAEAEINHNGSLSIAKEMIKTAKNCGADCIKFQYVIADEIAEKNSEYYPLFKKAELSQSEFSQLKEYAEECNIDFMMTVPSLDTLRYTLELGIKKIKVGSSNLTNILLLEAIASHKDKIEIFFSTGMGNLLEIETALEALNYKPNDKNFTIFHCTVNYPTEFKNANLNAIVNLIKHYPSIRIGFSDHTIGYLAPAIAVSLGAKCIEKHFTLDNNMEGPDHSFSSNPDNFKQMVEQVKNAQDVLGSHDICAGDSEQEIKDLTRRFFTAKKNIFKGEAFTQENLQTKRLQDTTGAINAKDFATLKKLTSAKEYKSGETLLWNHFNAN